MGLLETVEANAIQEARGMGVRGMGRVAANISEHGGQRKAQSRSHGKQNMYRAHRLL